tara:strand:- start:332 stop:532 length:201 start_codon:yes stop_codon:yes gene_type:complete
MELEVLIKELELRISILEDENASLWGMLDELRKSDVQNFQEALQKAHDELALHRMLIKMPAGGSIN